MKATITTIRDVAARAGCSIATVSRVVSGTGPASAAMRARVQAAVADLGFKPSMPGRSTRQALGVLVPSVTNPVFAAALAGIQHCARVAGLSVIITQSDYDPLREADAVKALIEERPLGLVLTVCNPDTSHGLRHAADLGVPTVLVYNEATSAYPAAVTVDNRAALSDLVGELVALGHRSILFVAGRFSTSDRSYWRYEGYCDAMLLAGLKTLPPVEVDFIEGASDIDLTSAFSRCSPTAIVASNDLLALTVIASVRRMGFDVPGDISVTGFDGIELGRLVTPRLTTIEQPSYTMGVSAASLLLDIVAGRAIPRPIRASHVFRRGRTIAPVSTKTCPSSNF